MKTPIQRISLFRLCLCLAVTLAGLLWPTGQALAVRLNFTYQLAAMTNADWSLSISNSTRIMFHISGTNTSESVAGASFIDVNTNESFSIKYVITKGSIGSWNDSDHCCGRVSPDCYHSVLVAFVPLPACLSLSGTNICTSGSDYYWHCFDEDGHIAGDLGLFPMAAEAATTLSAPAGDLEFDTCAKEGGNYTLAADGVSGTQASVKYSGIGGLTPPLTWSIQGDPLGCSINSTNGWIVAGLLAGTITVRVTDSNSCWFEHDLDVEVGGGCGAGSCQSDDLAVGTETWNRDPYACLSWAMGHSRDHGQAGWLSWEPASTISASLAIDAVKYRYKRRDVLRVETGSTRQYRSTEGLVDVVAPSSSILEVRFYRNGAFQWDFTQGKFVATGGAFKTWYFEDNGSNIEVRELVEGTSGTFYVSLLAGGVEVTRPNNLGTLRTVRANGWVTNQVAAVGGALAFQRLRRLEVVGATNRVVEEIVGDASSGAATMFYSYYSNGQLQSATNTAGFWRYLRYDSRGRLTNELSAFLDQAFTTNAALARSTEYYYVESGVVSGSSDTGAYKTNAARLVRELVQGTEVSRTFHVYLAGEARTIQCATPGAAWNASDNLVTITKTATSGADVGRLLSVEHPDGTMEIYRYDYDANFYRTNVVLRGEPNGGKTDIVNGSQSRTVIDPSDRILSRTTYDIAAGGVLVDSAIFSSFDTDNRPRKTSFLDGTFLWQEQDCCGNVLVTNRDGSTVTYTTDVLHRRILQTSLGVTISNLLDSAGHALATYRLGGGASHLVQSTSYDLAGRVTNRTDGLSRSTAIAREPNSRLTTTVAPDGATETETLWRDGSLKSVTGTGVHPARHTAGILSFGGVNRYYTAEIKLDGSGNDTLEAVTNVVDLLGRPLATLLPGATVSRYYNSLGQLTKVVDPDGVQTLYSYNGQGEVDLEVVDMNQNGAIDHSGPDRIRRQVTTVLTNGPGSTVRRTATYVWDQASGVSNLLSFADASVDGLQQWQVTASLTNWSVRSFSGTLHWTTSYSPDGAYTTSEQIAGRPATATRYSASGSQIGRMTNGYDNFGRLTLIWDARTGATTNGFDVADQLVVVATPAPVSGGSAPTTTNFYDARGRIWRIVLPDATSVTNEYFLTGELKKSSGSRTYPVAYAYDAQGRMTNLTTWQDAASGSGSAVTTWNYDSRRGWLTGKRYADGQGPDYTNSPGGRLIRRVWARSVGGNRLTTTYTRNGAGEVAQITYSDGVTPGVTNTFDRLGRLIQINHGTNTATRAYNLAGQLLSETQDGLVISNRFDAFLRRTNLSLLNGASTLASTHYGFDNAGRLAYVTDGTNVAGYSYLANSPLIQYVRFTNSGTLRFSTQKDYDLANRLANIASWNSSFTNSFAYTYNTGNQRTRAVLADGSYWVYEYDRLGQVTGGRKYWRDGSPVAGQQFGYAYDDIGNRKTASSGGDDLGLALRTSTYAANNLNQYTSRTVPGYLDILGAATNTATVLVNNRPTSRKDEYFRAELPVDNSQGAVWQGITNVAYLAQTTNVVATNQGNLFLPRTPETFSHDADGNLTNDGRWVYTWDAENRLTQVESLTTSPTASKRRVTYTYDWHGRRVRRQEFDGSSGSYVLTNDLRMAYDGWQCLGDLTTNLVLQRAYVWGLDLSGGRIGAGGVGGLLWYRSATNGTHYASYDANGNVTALTDAVIGIRSGAYEYGPFGQTLCLEGVAGADNGWRFSTKRIDPATELVLYEYRVYNWQIGQWLTVDPLQETGGINLRSYAQNNPIIKIAGDGRVVIPLDEWIRQGPLRPPEVHLATEILSDMFFNTDGNDSLGTRMTHQYTENGYNSDFFNNNFHINESEMPTLAVVTLGPSGGYDDISAVGIDIRSGVNFYSHVALLAKQDIVRIDDMPIFLRAQMSKTLGRFWGHVKGRLTGCPYRWQFNGSIHFVDNWDLEHDSTSGFMDARNVICFFGRCFLGGDPRQAFEITSDETPISQSSEQSVANWIGASGARVANSAEW